VKSNNIKAKKGATINLVATVKDPDNNMVAVNWWQYFEVDSYQGKLDLGDTSFTVPLDAKSGDTIHLIAEAVDNGMPALRGYQRIIVTVE
jgi:hypothetical protein